MINGEPVATTEESAAIDPSVGQEWATLAQADDSHVDLAVGAARDAFSVWRSTGPTRRQSVLDEIADRLEADADWPVMLATENGRPIREAELADVPTAAGIFRYYAGIARGLHGDNLAPDDPDLQVFTVREPVGVVAALIPWNSPLISTH